MYVCTLNVNVAFVASSNPSLGSCMNKLDKLIVVGDKVLIKPKVINNRTKGGLLLPPGYAEKEELQTGYIVKIGPGYPIPYIIDEDDEPWKKYVISRFRQKLVTWPFSFKKELPKSFTMARNTLSFRSI